jgi:3-deoxy-D-manno-octulosonic-acid transferase
VGLWPVGFPPMGSAVGGTLNPALRPFWALAVAAARFASVLAPDRQGKLSRTLRARRQLLSRIQAEASRRRDPSRTLVWLHAPSVGEGLQARPVLELLRRRHPEWQLAFSWFSPSAVPFAARLDVDLRAPLPFDGTHEAESILDAWQPDVLAFVKLDVWPRLAERAQRRGVRTALISATLAPNSGRQGTLARALLGDAYAGLDAVGAISADDGGRLVRLGAKPARIEVTGDTRMDQVWSRMEGVPRSHAVWSLMPANGGAGVPHPAVPHAVAPHPAAPEPAPPPVLVAGSTWPADEAVLLPAIASWLARTPEARCIIAPHEPTEAHLAPIEAWARDTGLPCSRLGDAERPGGAEWRVLLVDRVGVLGDLYALATIAFVGGGFHDAGLHSVLEPSAFGVPVLFGPRHQNAREAGALVRAGGGVVVPNSAVLGATLHTLTQDVARRTTAGAQARALVQEGRGSTGRVVALIERLVAQREATRASR